MKPGLTSKAWLAVVVGSAGIGGAWAWALGSKDADAAQDFLIQSPTLQEKYGRISHPLLAGFRISESRSQLTYWVKTRDGRVFVTLVVDKTTQPWTVRE